MMSLCEHDESVLTSVPLCVHLEIRYLFIDVTLLKLPAQFEHEKPSDVLEMHRRPTRVDPSSWSPRKNPRNLNQSTWWFD